MKRTYIIIFLLLTLISPFKAMAQDKASEAMAKDVKKVAIKRGRKPKGTIRILYWNIQNGMWSDQHHDFDNFVKWVKKYKPDICVWAEASSIYYDHTYKAEPDSLKILPSHWPEVAKRYGHKYTAIGGWRDNYPQEVTSRYPIRTILKITDTDIPGKPVSHGAALQQVDVNGTKINFVTLHMWPQGYGLGVSKEDQKASREKNEGDLYRAYEIEYIISKTINNPEYADQKNWIMLGDFNSRSRLDNAHYKYPENDARFLCQDKIAEMTDLKDAVYLKNDGKFCPTTYNGSRIDYVYLSEPLFERTVNARVVNDDWTKPVTSYYEHYFKVPSDHLPILIDIQL